MKRLLIAITALSMFLVFGGSAFADLNDGLVAHYPFSGNAIDSTGNGNDGNVFGATLTSDRFGNVESAYSFDGVDDYIEVNSFPIVFDYATVVFWIKTTNGINNYGPFTISERLVNSGGLGAAVGPMLDGHPADILKFSFTDDLYQTGKHPYIESNTSVSDGAWHQIVCVYDGNGKLYIDGIKEGELQRGSTLTLRNDTILHIGHLAQRAIGNFHFEGIIDDVLIYNRALSDVEIWELYKEGLLPNPDIKANGSDGPLEIAPGNTLSVTVELNPGIYAGYPADWWVLADTPFGWYYRDLSSGWQKGQVVTYQGPLFDLSPFEVLDVTLPEGSYTFYFGVDMVMNGSVDMGQMYYDSVDVTVQ